MGKLDLNFVKLYDSLIEVLVLNLTLNNLVKKHWMSKNFSSQNLVKKRPDTARPIYVP